MKVALPLLLAACGALDAVGERKLRLRSPERAAAAGPSTAGGASCLRRELRVAADPSRGRRLGGEEALQACTEARWREGARDYGRLAAFYGRARAAGFADAQVLVDVPSVQDVQRWREQVAVVLEGANNRVEGSSHWYNVVGLLLPHLLRFVLEPLRAANRSGAPVLLPKEAPPAPFVSPIERLAEILPEAKLSFVAGLPYCNTWLPECFLPGGVAAALASNTTLLIIPKALSIGWERPFDDATLDNSACASVHLATLRRHFLSPGPAAPVAAAPTRPPGEWPRQIALLRRPEDGAGRGAAAEEGQARLYHHERAWLRIPNMVELAGSLAQWAGRRGFALRLLQFEAMPFLEQVKEMQTSRILVGAEGAGLVNMVFFREPQSSAVVELNWADGKVKAGRQYEFPTIAKFLGLELWMHVFRCRHNDSDVGVDVEALEATLSQVLHGLRGVEGLATAPALSPAVVVPM